MDWSTILYCVVVAVLFLTIVFFVARHYNRYDLIDSAWGLAFIGIAMTSYLMQPSYMLFSVQSLVLVLVSIWGMRLSLHIYRRWSNASMEDRRYSELRSKYRKSFGGVAMGMYCKVYLVQALLAVIISLPVIIITADSLSTYWYVWTGLIIWLIGFYFEAMGDAQLAQFTRNPRNKGRLMTKGLWRFTRHPNYFGEITLWWGIFVISLAANSPFITIIGPLAITILILFVSGVPLTERHFEGRPGWSEYKRRTSRFIPLPPHH